MADTKLQTKMKETKELAEARTGEIRKNVAEGIASLQRAQSPSERLRQLREKIQRSGRILHVLSRVAEILLAINVAFAVLILVGCLFNKDLLNLAHEMYERNAFYRALQMIPGLTDMEPVFQGMIACFIAILSNTVLIFFIRGAGKLALRLAESGHPFDVEGARRTRKRAWLMLILMLYNVPLGLIATGMVLLFSYLMEYGGYIQEKADETSRIQEEMIVSFAEITENKSGQTGQHIRRVSEYARIIAEQLGLPLEQVENIRIASTMHDVGKLMIPTEILEKPGRLTDEEYAIIKTHTTYGGELLKNVEGDEMALSRTIALQHHERADGRGYPAGLAGDQISLEGRIVAVADVYDALTSRRSYKDAWKEDDAYQEILRCRGTQFDPEVVDAFAAAHEKIKEVQLRFADA